MKRGTAALALSLALVLGGCGDDESTESGRAAPAFTRNEADAALSYRLVDYSFDGPREAKGPKVFFEAENAGSEDHELEVLDPAGDAVGEIEAFPPGGKSEPLAAELPPGKYTLQCILETNEGKRHRDLGMVAELTVASSTTGATPSTPSEGADGYQPVSDVNAHAAIGQDVAKIKEALAPAKTGGAVDWPAVGTIVEKGGASRKSDGSLRSLAGLVSDSPALAFVRQAIAGTGAAGGQSEAVRAQYVEKGVTVLLADKVRAELGTARGKLEAKNLAPDSGAPHNVDEAWAFFSAQGQGPATTAEKRGADFQRTGQVKEPILAALRRAQKAAVDGDLATFGAAAADTGHGLDYVFYLATFKYLGDTSEAGTAEGFAFYQGIATRVERTDPPAHKAITGAFAGGDRAAGRAALNQPSVRAALGVDESQRVTG